SDLRDQVGLAGKVRVAADECCGAIQDFLERPPVVRERKALATEPAADVLDLRVTPAVDRLLRVTDDGHVSKSVLSQQPDEVQLDPVGVLEFVDEQVSEPLATPAAELWHALERVDYIEDQIVEIAQALGGQRFLVGAIHEVQNLDRLELRVRRLARRGV